MQGRGINAPRQTVSQAAGKGFGDFFFFSIPILVFFSLIHKFQMGRALVFLFLFYFEFPPQFQI
jgi:hypothetical protein